MIVSQPFLQGIKGGHFNGKTNQAEAEKNTGREVGFVFEAASQTEGGIDMDSVIRFRDTVLEHLKVMFPGGGMVEKADVTKNNNVIRHGISFTLTNHEKAIVYVEDFYSQFASGRSSIEDIAMEIMLSVKDPSHNMFRQFFEAENLQEKVFGVVVNKFYNADLLKTIPHHDLTEDLTVVYRYLIACDSESISSVQLTNKNLKLFISNGEDLYSIAQKNTKDLFPNQYTLLGDCLPDFMPIEENMPVYVLSNKQGINGATCVIDETFMNEVSQKCFEGKGFYILPSSIHEVLAMPIDFAPLDYLLGVVKEVNKSVVVPEDRLSDAVYSFDHNKIKLLTPISKKMDAIHQRPKMSP